MRRGIHRNYVIPRSKLDLHRHSLSPEVAAQPATLGPEVDVSELTEPDEWGGEMHRYVAVGE